MRILNISTSRLNYNGVGMVLLNYYKNINNTDIILDYLSPDVIEENYKKEITSKGNRVYELGYKGKKMRQKRPLKYCFKLYKILKNEKYDIVHVHGSSSMMIMEMIVAKIAGVKVRIAHSHNTKSDNESLDKILKPLFKRTYTHAFACGEEAGKWLFKDKKFEIINNAIDLSKYQFDEEKRKYMRKKYNLNGKKVIGHVGNFNNQKNHEYLIDIFYDLYKKDNEYYLVLIGKGSTEKEIKQKVEKLGIEDKVLFVGLSTKVQNWLQAMDIMVLPSKFEGFPNVLVEWQASGLPCIVSNKVTDKVKLTRLVKMTSIEDAPCVWSNIIRNIEIKDRKKNNEEILSEIRKKGFDIKYESRKLEKIYYSLIKKVG